MDVGQVWRDIIGLADKDPSHLLALAILLFATVYLMTNLARLARQTTRFLASITPSGRRERALRIQEEQDAVVSMAQTMHDLSGVVVGLAQNQNQLSSAVAQIATVITRLEETTRHAEQRADENKVAISTLRAQFEASNTAAEESRAGLTEAVRTLSVATEKLINRATESETASMAQASRDKAVVDINTHTDAALKPIGEAVLSLPPHLDALKLKMDELPGIVKDAYIALVNERNAEREQKEQAQASLATFQSQNAKLTSDLMARDTTIAQKDKELHDYREMLAQMKLEKAAVVEATGLPPIVPKPGDSPAVPL